MLAMETKRFLFVMWEGGGNIPPQLGLARQLVDRGHEVRVLTEPSVAQDVIGTGASFATFTTAPHRDDRLRESDFVRDVDARTPLGAFAAARDRVLLGPAAAYAADTAAEIDRFRPDVLAADWMLTGAAVAGEARAVPTALLIHNVDLIPSPGKPAPGLGLAPASSALGRARDRLLTAALLSIFNRGLPALNGARRSLGLAPLGHVLEQMDRPDRLLCLYSEAFDYPAPTTPSVRYVGPVLEQPAWAEPWASTWDTGDTRPLVVISLSTTFMRQEQALRRCIEAVKALPVRALVTVGPAMDPAAFRSAESIAVVRSAPHESVFPLAAAVITHAGMGTVNRALAHGLPLVCLPLGRDQGDVAARVVWHGAGLRVAPPLASAAKLRRSLLRVLHEASFRASAVRLQAAIAADLAAGRATAELEALATSGPIAVTP